MKNVNPVGLFDEHFLLEKLTKLNDPLVKLNDHIDWNIFIPLFQDKFEVNDKKVGRPRFDYILMFKILILQSLYNLSDDDTEYLILDRRSYMRFLGLKISDKVPDSKTIWLFRETLLEAGIIDSVFSCFNNALEQENLIAKKGQIVDASFVEVPRQRNTKEENKVIKEGKTPEAWAQQPYKLRQKDVDARWTKKNNVTFYGYKNHIKMDNGSKFITQYAVTNAAQHDSVALEDLLDFNNDANQALYGDSAYTGQEDLINDAKMIDKIHEKGYRNNPLTENQKASNRQKSKVRARVEHAFGFMTNSMNAMRIHTIGIWHAYTKITLTNLTYNMMRCVQLHKKIYAV